jgi:hypothetical protein
MQMCCYNNVKYLTKILISILPCEIFGHHLVGNFFLFFLSVMGRFSTKFVVSYRWKSIYIYIYFILFLIRNFKGYVTNYQRSTQLTSYEQQNDLQTLKTKNCEIRWIKWWLRGKLVSYWKIGKRQFRNWKVIWRAYKDPIT